MKNTRMTFILVVIFLMGFLLPSCMSVDNLVGGKASDDKLHEGIIVNNLEMINEALEEGADINQIKGTLLPNSNPVWIAFKNAMSQRVPEYLINRGADVNIPDTDGTSLLMYMASNTDVHFCELLIEHGAKIDYEYKGSTALECVLDYSGRGTATEENVDKILTLLLENGAQIRPATLKATLEGFRSKDSKTMYHVRKRILEGLIKSGHKSGLDPALEAALLGQSSKLIKLINEDKIKKEDKEQILFSTAAFGSADAMQLLNQKGSDLGFHDKYNYTPLIVASFYGNLEMVKYLVAQGVDLEVRTIDAGSNKSALNVAVENDQSVVAEYLIKKGAESGGALNKTSQNDNDLETLKLSIANGTNVDGRTEEGWPLRIASEKGQTEIVKYLIEKGANVNAVSTSIDGKDKGKKMEPALYMAIIRGNFDIVKLLVEIEPILNIKLSMEVLVIVLR